MLRVKNFYTQIKSFLDELSKDSVSAYSAEAAFFLVVSFFPFLMLLITLFQYIPFTEEILAVLTDDYLPGEIGNMVKTILDELSKKTGTTIISVTALTTLYAASRGIFSFIKGLNGVYKVDETRNYVALRLSSLLYTAIFAIGLTFALVLLVFGNHILSWLAHKFTFMEELNFILLLKQIVAFLFLTVFFWLIYRFAPNRKTKFFAELPGAIFSSVGWLIFSLCFSFYISHIGNFSYLYGSLTTVVVVMLWLYFCMYIVFLGAELNKYILKRRERHNIKK